MAAITAALIKQVREDTGAGMLDVKKALTEAEGDVARAKEIIRAKGIAAAGKREGRKAQEGTIASKVVETANGETGYAVELNSETDFVAKTPKFVEFADEVLGYAVDADVNSAEELEGAKAGDTTVKLAVEEAAVKYIAATSRSFSAIKNENERMKFVLAAYNAGIGHVLDAMALAEKYGKNKYVWDNSVDDYILLKSNEEYFNDPVCKNGYFRGVETYNFVKEVMSRGEVYKKKIKD